VEVSHQEQFFVNSTPLSKTESPRPVLILLHRDFSIVCVSAEPLKVCLHETQILCGATQNVVVLNKFKLFWWYNVGSSNVVLSNVVLSNVVLPNVVSSKTPLMLFGLMSFCLRLFCLTTY
jgi:hypothetical protein